VALPEWGITMADHHFATVDGYIGSFPVDVKTILQEIRQTIRNAVPIAGETITYQIPTITLDGTALLYFAGWKHHISFYPVPTGDEAFEQQVEPYRSAKSTLKFPLSDPIPYDLIEQVVRTPPRTAAGQQAHTLIAFRELG
jgi:uncharacterized protein YdhG (YjbR/CyaY superfamily)